MEVLGLPPSHLMEVAKRKKNFFDELNKPKIVPNSRGRMRYPNTRTLENKIKCLDSKFLDLLFRTLEWDPKNRITPEQALEHPWIQEEIYSRPRRRISSVS